MASVARILEALGTTIGGTCIGLAAGFAIAGPIGAIALSVPAGLNGAVAGISGIYDWRRFAGWFAFVADSSWGLVMTTLGLAVTGANALLPRARRVSSLSYRENRHVFDGGIALQRNMAMTIGNVTSNGDPSGTGLDRPFLDRHEGMHIWQSRVFGPVFPLVYVAWGALGAVAGCVVWLFRPHERLFDLVQAIAYYDNPFEYWAYRNDRNWPPAGAHPALLWPPRRTQQRGTAPPSVC